MFTIPIVFFIVVFLGYNLTKEKNPYINAHENKWLNEKHYDNYIKWLDQKGGDKPLNQVRTKEEKELIDKILK